VLHQRHVGDQIGDLEQPVLLSASGDDYMGILGLFPRQERDDFGEENRELADRRGTLRA